MAHRENRGPSAAVALLQCMQHMMQQLCQAPAHVDDVGVQPENADAHAQDLPQQLHLAQRHRLIPAPKSRTDSWLESCGCQQSSAQVSHTRGLEARHVQVAFPGSATAAAPCSVSPPHRSTHGFSCVAAGQVCSSSAVLLLAGFLGTWLAGWEGGTKAWQSRTLVWPRPGVLQHAAVGSGVLLAGALLV